MQKKVSIGSLKTLPLHMVILFAVVAVVYSGSIKNGFVYDDNSQILANPWVRDMRFLPDILFSSIWAFIEKDYSGNYYRPVSNLAFMIEYHFFGPEPMGWHIVNIALHALNAAIVYFIARAMLKKLDKEAHRVVPLFAALVFAAHPVNSETVSWVSCVPELVYVLFFLLAFLFYMRGYYYLSVFFFFLSVLSKETALALVVLFMFYDSLAGRLVSVLKSYKRYAPYLVVALVYLVLRFYALGGFYSGEKMHPYLTSRQYFINIFPLLGDYVWALVFPLRHRPFPLFEPVFSVFEPRALVPLMFTAGLAASALFFRKKIQPMYLFFIAVILLPLLPVFYIPALSRNVFADRYLYLPSVGFSLLIAFFIPLLARLSSYIAAGILVLVTAIYSTAAFNRNKAWQ
ncbi:MAG: hypothetical protein HY880_04105, partial [Deltaproteobacteria bacterium]|nr:hypothetical protein [Deltaproteobacteria bacterium]